MRKYDKMYYHIYAEGEFATTFEYGFETIEDALKRIKENYMDGGYDSICVRDINDKVVAVVK